MITKEEQLALSNQKVFVLMKEYDIINQKIEQFLSRQPAMFGAGVVAILTIVGFLSKDSVDEFNINNRFLLFAVFSLPFFTLLYLDIILYHYMRTMTLQGYKRALELKINDVMGDNYLNFSMVGMGVENKNFYRVAFLIGFLALIGFSLLIPYLVVSDNYEYIIVNYKSIYYVVVGLFILFFIASLIAALFIPKAFYKAIQATKKEQNSFKMESNSKSDLNIDVTVDKIED